MANITCQDIFPNLTVLDTNSVIQEPCLAIPLSLFPENFVENFDPETSDGRELLRQLDLQINEAWNQLLPENKPQKMTNYLSTTNLQNGNKKILVERSYEVYSPIELLSLVPENNVNS